MNFGDIVGQMLREGMSPATRGRLEHSMGQGGLGDMFGNVLGAAAGAGAGGGSAGGGLGDILGQLGRSMSADSGVGGMSRGEMGSIGALAGALLGGGGGAMKGAVGGGAMALLGTLALSALKNWQSGAGAGAAAGAAAVPAASDDELARMTAPQTAELCLLGMIEAAKADGQIGPEEAERITGKLREGGITPEEQAHVSEALARPADPDGLVARIPDAQTGAQVYAAALMAISVDTPGERAFLARLAEGSGLDRATVERLHGLVGAPAP